MPPPMNSLNKEFFGISSTSICSKYFKNSVNLFASAYSFSSFPILLNNGNAYFFSAFISYINEVLNITSASSWNGNMYFSSPADIEYHDDNVFSAS